MAEAVEYHQHVGTCAWGDSFRIPTGGGLGKATEDAVRQFVYHHYPAPADGVEQKPVI